MTQNDMAENKHWFVGAMNDGLFIIDRQPRTSNDDVWHDRPDGPDMVLNVTELPLEKAQAICDAHNALLDEIEKLRETKPAVVTLTQDEAERVCKRLEYDASWDKCGSGYYSMKRQLPAPPVSTPEASS